MQFNITKFIRKGILYIDGFIEDSGEEEKRPFPFVEQRPFFQSYDFRFVAGAA